MPVQVAADRPLQANSSQPFLRVPPFPGRKIDRFWDPRRDSTEHECLHGIADLIRRMRVGGSFWGAQPELPSRYVLFHSSSPVIDFSDLAGGLPTIVWSPQDRPAAKNAHIAVTGECDPWHMLGNAAAFVTTEPDELVAIATLLEIPVHLQDPATNGFRRLEPDLSELLREVLPAGGFVSPFTGESVGIRDAIELCGFWRRLIDANRGLAGGLGFAFWKQANVSALLWDGAEPFQYFRSVADAERHSGSIAVWRSKIPANALKGLENRGRDLIEVEDGFLRSQGLGADCIPPLSITVDRQGAHFDPLRPSELEDLLQNGEFDARTLERARYLRKVIVASGLSKYNRGSGTMARPDGSRRHVLVPGQVEDDRSVQLGGCGLTANLDLLIRVRQETPDSYILYKPHPDVLAGHRKGAIPEEHCFSYCDAIVGDEPISALIEMVDEVHVNTSLAGFEALMRGKRVTTYGVPFYAGWGLTNDFGPVPARRSATRTLDELIAAALLMYPRYLDPVTGLPCPPEVVVARLIDGDVPDNNLLVAARRLQGKMLRRLRSLVQ